MSLPISSDPTAHFRNQDELDRAMRAVTHSTTGASVTRGAEAPDLGPVIEQAIDDVCDLSHSFHSAAKGLAVVGTILGAGTAALQPIAGAASAGVVVTTAEMLALEGASQGARESGQEVDVREMHGAIAFALGFIDNPDETAVADQWGTSERGGAREMRAFAESNPVGFQALRDRLVNDLGPGLRAVLQGVDSGRDFDQRCSSNPTFKLGVDLARELRVHDYAQFCDQARDLQAVADARRSGKRA